MCDPTPSARPSAKRDPIVLFDGVCNLCSGAVRWIIARDAAAEIRFASLQSAVARELLAARGLLAIPDSLVLIDEAGVHLRSDGAIRLARHLGFPWSLAIVAKLVPRSIRDALYNWIVRNRYRWFGRKATCMVPTPELRARFLDSAISTPQCSRNGDP